MKPKTPQLVVTGGPMSGKDTFLAELVWLYGNRIIAGQEAATVLFEMGYPRPGQHGVVWSHEWQRDFQPHVHRLQLLQESIYQQQAAATGAKVILLNRGPLDGWAYHHGGPYSFQEILDRYPIDYPDCYGGILHLETVATTNPELFGTTNNEHRYEDSPERAIELDILIRRAWSEHPAHRFVSSCSSKDEKIIAALAAFREILSLNGIEL